MNPHDSPHKNRLWTPWRMRYIGGDAREDGCIFCNRLRAEDDVTSLILHRAGHCFVIMNLFPYNTGHVMVVPNAHAADLGELDEATLTEMAILLPVVTRTLKRVFGCDGFNIGLNLGAVAGAGVAAHLHQHVVPRWQGDANFMPILAGTMAIPEMIPSSYAKIRAELERELYGAERFDVVVVSDGDAPRSWLRDEGVPTVQPTGDEPAWKAAVAAVGTDGTEIVGWSGGTRASSTGCRPGLVIRTPASPAGDGWQAVPWGDESGESVSVTAEARRTLARVRSHLAPWIAETS